MILTQPEAWEAAHAQFPAIDSRHVIYLRSMEYEQLMAMEQALPHCDIVMGIGGGQAMDAAKYVAWRRHMPLILAPTIVSVDAAVTNTIAVRERQRVRYIGFQVANAVAVDLAVIAQAPMRSIAPGLATCSPSIPRCGIGISPIRQARNLEDMILRRWSELEHWCASWTAPLRKFAH